MAKTAVEQAAESVARMRKHDIAQKTAAVAEESKQARTGS